jgi:hypothetical protein
MRARGEMAHRAALQNNSSPAVVDALARLMTRAGLDRNAFAAHVACTSAPTAPRSPSGPWQPTRPLGSTQHSLPPWRGVASGADASVHACVCVAARALRLAAHTAEAQVAPRHGHADRPRYLSRMGGPCACRSGGAVSSRLRVGRGQQRDKSLIMARIV